MDFRIAWTDRSLRDLRDIVRYIARDDRETARRFGEFLVAKVDILEAFPRIGRIVPEFHLDGLREIIVAPYRIVYEIDDIGNTLSILRIWHGARGGLELGEEN